MASYLMYMTPAILWVATGSTCSAKKNPLLTSVGTVKVLVCGLKHCKNYILTVYQSIQKSHENRSYCHLLCAASTSTTLKHQQHHHCLAWSKSNTTKPKDNCQKKIHNTIHHKTLKPLSNDSTMKPTIEALNKNTQ